jgi:acyl-homoserine lactone acylase PvdQ
MGIVYAEDRLFQMTFRIYSVQGRLSEFLGEKTLDFDKYMRELNLKGWAEKRAERMLK